jgi:lipopolysaccharide transport system ATP-binding protein
MIRATGFLPQKPALTGSLLPNNRQLREGEFWANRDINFELRRGECLGLIGRNGAGKTTLLKMLNGILKPDTGRITQKGRMGSLIALGAGFSPILSGRENIIANGMVLGLSNREIRDKMEEIIDFANLREFIDAPVRNYSSGMQMRLGFAIATVITPDILILDEVLAVGDASFRHKCYNRINKLIKRSAVILVSHSMEHIAQTATSVAVLNKGEFTYYRDPIEGITAYNNSTNDEDELETADGGTVTAFYPPVTNVHVKIPQTVEYGASMTIDVELILEEELADPIVSFTAINRNDQSVMCLHSKYNSIPFCLKKGRQTLRMGIEQLQLHPGKYKWCFGMMKRGSIEHIIWFMRAGTFSVTRNTGPIGDIPYLPISNNIEIIPRQ